MGLQEAILKREKIVTVEVPGLGPVRFQRLETAPMMALPDEEQGLHLVLLAVLRDQEDKPFFSDLAAVKATDWGIVTALVAAAREVNTVRAATAEAVANAAKKSTPPPASGQ